MSLTAFACGGEKGRVIGDVGREGEKGFGGNKLFTLNKHVRERVNQWETDVKAKNE